MRAHGIACVAMLAAVGSALSLTSPHWRLAAEESPVASDHPHAKRPEVVVASKAFTESVVLGELIALLLNDAGYATSHKAELGGTQVLWQALRTGEVDIYPEYTGTLRREMFTDRHLPSLDDLREALAAEGLLMSEPLGFSNSYALGVPRALAEELQLEKVSDLTAHPELRFGFSNEFMDRTDGWPSLQRRYALPQKQVRGMQHELTYRALESGDIDLMAVYMTDPQIELHDLVILEDDKANFPRYDAVILYRQQLAREQPHAVEAMEKLIGALSQDQMLRLNYQVEATGLSEQRVAADFLAREFAMELAVEEEDFAVRLLRTTAEHLLLVAISLAAAILTAVPLGVIAAKFPRSGQVIVAVVEVVQTIPGLALLVLIAVLSAYLGLPTIGAAPVIAALFLYSLLPIVRNTMAGLAGVPPALMESAAALGLPPGARLWRVELPLAAPLILAGIKTTAVINVGYAALGGLIGAGGYGQPIMTGLRLNSEALMLEGAIPAALLALAVKGAFSLLERYVVPRGLRLSSGD